MFDNQLTVVVCSRRPLVQVERLVSLLREQTVRPEVWVWNYNKEYYLPGSTADFVANYAGPDSLRHMPALYHIVETPYICRMDDDVYPADTEVLEEALWTHAKHKNNRLVLGPCGVRLRHGQTYQAAHHIATPKGQGQFEPDGQAAAGPRDFEVDLVKSRLQLFMTEAAKAWMRCEFEHPHDDLYTSFRLAGARRRYHLVSGVFYYRDWADPAGSYSRLPELDPLPVDAEVEAARLAERDQISQDWLGRCGPGGDDE